MEDRARHLIRIAAFALVVAALAAGCGSGARQAAVRRPAFLCVAAPAPAAGRAGGSARELLSGMRRELAAAGGRAGGFRVRLCVIGAADADRDDGAASTPVLRAFGAARRGAGVRAGTGGAIEATSAAVSAAAAATGGLPAQIAAAAVAARRSTVIAFAGAQTSVGEQEAAPILAAAGIPQLAVVPMPPASSATQTVTAPGEPAPVTRPAPSTTLFLVPSLATQARVAEQILRVDHGCTHVVVYPASGSAERLADLVSADLVAAGAAVSSAKSADCLFVAAGGPVPQFAHTLELGAPAACTSAWGSSLPSTAIPPPDLVGGPPDRATSRLCFLPAGVTQGTSAADYGAATMQVILDTIDRLGARADDRSAVLAALESTSIARTPIGAVAFAHGNIVTRTFTVYGVTAGHLQADGSVTS